MRYSLLYLFPTYTHTSHTMPAHEHQPQRYGCYDRKIVPTMRYQVGWTEDGRRLMADRPFRLGHVCQWEARHADPRCAGCQAP